MPLIEGSRVKGRGFPVRAWELGASSVKREDRGEHIVDLLRSRCRAAEGAHQPLIRIKASEGASVLRALGSLELPQKIVGSRPCPRGEATVAWLTGSGASASTLWAHGMGAPSLNWSCPDSVDG